MSELFAGLDVSDLTTAVCVIDGAGAVVLEVSVASAPGPIALALKPYRRLLKTVGHEAGPKGAWLHKGLTKKGLPIVYLDARAASASLKQMRNKTDKNDARGLAQLVRSGCYKRAHVKSDEALRLRFLLNARRALKRKARALERLLGSATKLFGANATKSGGRLTVAFPGKYADLSSDKVVLALTRSKDCLLDEAKALDALIRKLADADPVCRSFMTIPGVGPMSALIFKSGVDDPGRFASSRNVAAHFGLTPRVFQSGQSKVMGGISLMGDEMVRTALYSAAFVMLCNSKSDCALRVWGLHLREKKGLKPACIAVARKLAVLMHRMWVTGRAFDPMPADLARPEPG